MIAGDGQGEAIIVNHSRLTLDSLGADDARGNVDQVVISETDTGGEFRNNVVQVTNSYVKDIPSPDLTFENDDNDGFYSLNDYQSKQEATVDDILAGLRAAFDRWNRFVDSCRHSSGEPVKVERPPRP